MTDLVGQQNSSFGYSKEDFAIDIDANMQKKADPLSAQLSKPLSERSRRYSYEKNEIKCMLPNQISKKI